MENDEELEINLYRSSLKLTFSYIVITTIITLHSFVKF